LEFRLQAVPRYAEMMSATGYLWRQLNPKQREELLEWRKACGHPWHSPPHRPNFGHLRFHISAACYEHRDHIGQSLPRIDNFTRDLLAVLAAHAINSAGFMAALHTIGTPKNVLPDERSSSVLSSARCVRIGITGRG
jgi:hypothetical protein